MDKKTIGMILILMMASGIVGFIFGAQNSESLPIILANNTTDDSGDFDLITTKKTTTNKTNSTIKKNKTNSTINNNVTLNSTVQNEDP